MKSKYAIQYSKKGAKLKVEICIKNMRGTHQDFLMCCCSSTDEDQVRFGVIDEVLQRVRVDWSW